MIYYQELLRNVIILRVYLAPGRQILKVTFFGTKLLCVFQVFNGFLIENISSFKISCHHEQIMRLFTV